MSNDDDEIGDDLKALSGLYSLLCYAERELGSLQLPCDEAEDAVASARAAVRDRIASAKSKVVSVEAADDPEILLN